MWLNWTDIILGLVLIVIAFMDLTGQALFWMVGGAGLLLVIAGFVSFSQLQRTQVGRV